MQRVTRASHEGFGVHGESQWGFQARRVAVIDRYWISFSGIKPTEVAFALYLGSCMQLERHYGIMYSAEGAFKTVVVAPQIQTLNDLPSGN